MDKNHPEEEEFARFRAEAAKVIGFQDQPNLKPSEDASPKE
jgi:hypothetical protein